jgi:hypothetical protein
LHLGIKEKYVGALAAWSSGNVSAWHRGDWSNGREIETRQGIHRVAVFLEKQEKI